MDIPNGIIATITHISNIHFSNFTLHDVLCVPSFKINLITISKLVRHSHYLATLINDDCMLQDQQLEKMIGT